MRISERRLHAPHTAAGTRSRSAVRTRDAHVASAALLEKENRAALDLRLTTEDFAALDKAFPPPRGPKALEML